MKTNSEVIDQSLTENRNLLTPYDEIHILRGQLRLANHDINRLGQRIHRIREQNREQAQMLATVFELVETNKIVA